VNKKQKIFVGVSGGVDSSVAAYLLKEEGHEVHGVFVKTWSPDWLPCTWVDEKRDAMRVCAALDIPFHFLDAEEAYKEGVADYMISEYRAGRTPNPDVLCNRVIKFGALWEYAKSQGADAVATGHYARIEQGALLTAVDPAKDQSYFLWMLEVQELSHIRFPIGHLQKNEVRAIAKKAKLFTAEKKDSQGICFLGDVDMREFLSHYIDEKKGSVVNEKGEVVGEHDGVRFYTLGERHGFRITAQSDQHTPYYVVGKNIEDNVLVVAARPQIENNTRATVQIELRDANWLSKPKTDKRYTAQIRYHGTRIPAKRKKDGSIELTYGDGIPLGQSLVLYDGEILLGGGVMDKIL
jgi:tRNA-uridine 2-sulfurtransferase